MEEWEELDAIEFQDADDLWDDERPGELDEWEQWPEDLAGPEYWLYKQAAEEAPPRKPIRDQLRGL